MLCNHGGAPAATLAHRVADLYLGSAVTDPAAPKAVTLAPSVLSARAGLYRNAVTGQPLRLSVRDGKLVDDRGTEAVPVSATVFRNPNGGQAIFELSSDGRPRVMRLLQEDGDTLLFLPVEPYAPSPEDQRGLVGTYVSEEAATTITIAHQDGKLLLRQRPTVSFEMRPAYRDVFEIPTGDIVRFIRDGSGKVTEMSLFLGRVRDLRFKKQ